MALWLLRKGRNPLTKVAGRVEGAPVKNILKNPKRVKSRPNASGYAPLQTPSFGKVANRTKLSQRYSKAPQQRPTGRFFKRGTKIKFVLADGTSGQGKVKDYGPLGVQLVTDNGETLNVFYSEISGQETDNGKTVQD